MPLKPAIMAPEYRAMPFFGFHDYPDLADESTETERAAYLSEITT